MEFGIFSNGYVPGPAAHDSESEHTALMREFGVDGERPVQIHVWTDPAELRERIARFGRTVEELRPFGPDSAVAEWARLRARREFLQAQLATLDAEEHRPDIVRARRELGQPRGARTPDWPELPTAPADVAPEDAADTMAAGRSALDALRAVADGQPVTDEEDEIPF